MTVQELNAFEQLRLKVKQLEAASAMCAATTERALLQLQAANNVITILSRAVDGECSWQEVISAFEDYEKTKPS